MKDREQVLFNLIPRHPRVLNAIVAFFNGYFWLPCPICGKKFAGYESANDALMNSWSSGEMVCWRCGEKAKKANQELFKNLPPPPVFVE